MPLNITDNDAYREMILRVGGSLEDKYAQRIANIISRFWRRSASVFDFPGILDVSANEVEIKMADAIFDLYEDTASTFFKIAFDAAKDSSKAWLVDVHTKGSKADARGAVAEWIRANALRQSKFIRRGMVTRAREIIARGIESGKTQAQIARQLAEGGFLKGFLRGPDGQIIRRDPLRQARTIVRTEVYRAQSETTHQAIEALGLTIQSKSWITMNDGLVRTTHQSVTAADGVTLQNNFEMVSQIVESVGPRGGRVFTTVGPKVKINNPRIPMGSKFIVGGFEADYPRDASLPAQEAINCRCVLAYYEEAVPKQRRRRQK
jgi:Phage Mu protein F like protein